MELLATRSCVLLGGYDGVEPSPVARQPPIPTRMDTISCDDKCLMAKNRGSLAESNISTLRTTTLVDDQRTNRNDRDGGDTTWDHAVPSIYILCATVPCSLATRIVDGINTTTLRFLNAIEAKEMHQDGRLVVGPKIEMVESAPLMDAPGVRVKNYMYDAAARLLSHLEAVRTAYTDGSEVAFFLEENAVLEPSFWNQWKHVAATAPSDWNALQWSTDNAPTLLQNVQLHKNQDQWVSWLPDHIGTHAYTLNRKGMEAILANTRKTVANKNVWNVDLMYPMLEPHEVLFYLASPAYTATFPWSQTPETSQILANGELLPLPSSDVLFQPRHESVLVLMNIRLKSNETLAQEFQRLQTDVEILCDYHHAQTTNCHWLVNIVLTESSLLPLYHEWSFGFSPHVVFEMQISNQPFNKFAYLVRHIPILHNYDIVVFKDNDQRITGTPWNTLLQKKEKAIMVGSLRQVVAESFRGTQTYRTAWFNSAENWKSGLEPWSFDLFVNIDELEINWLEMHLVVMDGNFAEWFWPLVLLPEFVTQPSNWGIDQIWCAAAMNYAKETNSTKVGCTQVPVISLHEDTAQITKDAAFIKAGEEAVEKLFQTLSYPLWSETTLGKIIHSTTHRKIRQRCERLLESPEVDIRQCFKEAIGTI